MWSFQQVEPSHTYFVTVHVGKFSARLQVGEFAYMLTNLLLHKGWKHLRENSSFSVPYPRRSNRCPPAQVQWCTQCAWFPANTNGTIICCTAHQSQPKPGESEAVPITHFCPAGVTGRRYCSSPKLLEFEVLPHC
jgi:hypothetical protein